MSLYYVYTQRMCAELMLKGHKLRGVEPSKKRKGYNVFVFTNSEELKDDINKLTLVNR